MRGALVGISGRLLLVFRVVLAIPGVGSVAVAVFRASRALLVPGLRHGVGCCLRNRFWRRGARCTCGSDLGKPLPGHLGRPGLRRAEKACLLPFSGFMGLLRPGPPTAAEAGGTDVCWWPGSRDVRPATCNVLPPSGSGLPPGSLLAPWRPLYGRRKSREGPSRSFGSSPASAAPKASLRPFPEHPEPLSSWAVCSGHGSWPSPGPGSPL